MLALRLWLLGYTKMTCSQTGGFIAKVFQAMRWAQFPKAPRSPLAVQMQQPTRA